MFISFIFALKVMICLSSAIISTLKFIEKVHRVTYDKFNQENILIKIQRTLEKFLFDKELIQNKDLRIIMGNSGCLPYYYSGVMPSVLSSGIAFTCLSGCLKNCF